MNVPASPPVRKKIVAIEFLAFTAIGWLPSAIQGVVTLTSRLPRMSSLVRMASDASLYSTIKNLAIVAAIIFTLWVSGELKILRLRFNIRWDPLIVAGVVGIWVIEATERGWFHHRSHALQTIRPSAIAFAFLGIAASAFYQELLIRGYMMPRLTELFDSEWLGLGISTVLFGLWHLYEGTVNAFETVVYGGILGFVVLRTGRLWPAVIVHTITNGTIFMMYLGWI